MLVDNFQIIYMIVVGSISIPSTLWLLWKTRRTDVDEEEDKDKKSS